MNKRQARAEALENKRTIGELRMLIVAARGRGGKSRVNPIFTLEEALDIYDAGLSDRDQNEIPQGMRPDPYSPTDRMRATGDSLMIRNILRDCI